MNPLAQLVPVLALGAIGLAAVFVLVSLPRDQQRTEQRSAHVQAFFGRTSAATTTADAAESTDAEPTKKDQWSDFDVSMFDNDFSNPPK